VRVRRDPIPVGWKLTGPKSPKVLEVALHNHRLVCGHCVVATYFGVEQSFKAMLRQRIAVAILCLLAPLSFGQRASMQSFQIPSHGALLNAFVYVAAGPGPHPAVVLLHGFPGNERNLDLAQDIRSAGWDVLYFDYRGSWGSLGDFSFSHGIEDTAAAIDYLRSAPMARILRLDPSRIVLIGHSLGGFMAVQAAAADPGIVGVGLISAADVGGRIARPFTRDQEQATIKALSAAYDRDGMEPLSGCSPEGLAHEAIANATQWSFMNKVGALKTRPLLIVTSEDAYARGDQAFAAALRRAGNSRVATLHLPTDHAYSDQRGPLSSAFLRWLATVAPPAATH
jgi:pimeloyl-ACP methyl ester carboxylesterase